MVLKYLGKIRIEKAQVSVEYLSIFILSFLLLTPLIFYANKSMQESRDAIKIQKIDNALKQISGIAKLLYAQEEGAKKEIFINLPAGIQRGYVAIAHTDKGAVSIFYKDQEIHVSSVPIIGNLPLTQGNHRIYLEVAYGSYVDNTTDSSTSYKVIYLHELKINPVKWKTENNSKVVTFNLTSSSDTDLTATVDLENLSGILINNKNPPVNITIPAKSSVTFTANATQSATIGSGYITIYVPNFAKIKIPVTVVSA